MTEQLRLFDDAALGEAVLSRKERALRQVEEHAEEVWKETALECVKLTALRLGEFTSDDVAEELVRYPVWTSTTRALGPVMLKAAKLGYCRITNRVRNSRRDELHNQRLSVWVSLIAGRQHERRR
jgi:hypothetical protein